MSNNKRKSIIQFALLLTLLFVNTYASAQNFETKAKYAYAVDLDTGEVLVDINSSKPMTPSSMSKLMTIYIVFKYLSEGKIKLDDTFNVSKKAWSAEGSRTFLKHNTNVRVEDLIRGVIVQSGNDASITLAEGIAGDEKSFVRQMNAAATEIGMKNSCFMNATGLPHKKHLMTPEDLFLLAKAIITKYPQYLYYFSEKEFKYNNISQPNRISHMGYLGINGLKTGHTNAGGYGVVLSATSNNKRVVAVINGMKSKKERGQESKKIINHIMVNFKNITLFKAGDTIEKVKGWYCNKSKIDLISPSDIVLTLPKEKQESDLKIWVEYKSPIVCPVDTNIQLATLFVENEDKKLIFPLYAKHKYDKSGLFRKMWQNIKYLSQ